MTTLKHHKQIEFMNHPARFKFVLAGRRGGKTRGISELICEDIHKCPDKGTVFYIGPTNQQAMELIWEDLEDRIDDLGWRCRPLISKQRFEFSRRRRVQIIGAEKIRRIRGRKAFSVYMDEIGFWDVDLFKAWRAVRPALSDLKGKAVAATTPDGKGSSAYQFYRAVMEPKKGKDNEFIQPWTYFEWMTRDNPFIDPDEIEDAKIDLDEKSFRQEYEAKWESFEGLAYYNFDEGLHIARESIQKIDLSKPVGLSFDFNVNPTTILLIQEDGGRLLNRREYSIKNSDTVTTLKNFCEDYRQVKDQIHIDIHGDSTGNSRRSNTGRSDYHYILELLTERGFKYTYKVPGANPGVVDRVAHVNGYLKNVKGESRTLIDPSCRDLITDLASQKLEGRFPSDKGNLGHKADAWGYRVWWQHVSSNQRKSTLEDLT